MPLVYSYLRFSDPRQAEGSSADRQLEYAQRWAAERGLVLDESLSLRDEGLSGYHSRHVSHGALGVFLRAVEDGHIEAGSVLVVEGLDRLSRAEPLKAQAQLTQIIHAGIRVVTAADGQEYSLESIKANPYRLIHSLVVMIRAHEESDTKSKRVRAAIRRQCEAWTAGMFRGVIRNGRDPQWLRREGDGWALIDERAAAVRYAVQRFVDGLGAVTIMREMAAAGMVMTDSGKLNSNTLYRTLRNRVLIGEREFDVGGEVYRLDGYYPPLLTAAEFDALQVAVDRRQGRRGVGEIPSILTGMGICTCGYCGAAIVSQNLMGRKRQPDGRPWPGHRRLICTSNASGHGCPVPGSLQSVLLERALMLYCADSMRMTELQRGGDQGRAQRAELAGARKRLASAEAKLDRLAAALAGDDGAVPITVLRSIRMLEAETETEKKSIDGLERELSGARPPASPDVAEKWLGLMEGSENLDTDARMQARELVRASFSRIVIWHSGEGLADQADGSGRVIEMELTARGGGQVWLRVDRDTGRMVDG
jgi:DNA invertase Pin-like site-specific DNA recombinase